MNPTRPFIPAAEFRKLFEQTRSFAKEDVRKSWFYLLSTLALCAGTIFLASRDWLPMSGRIVASIFSALLYVRLFILYHDYEHGAIFTNSPVAGAIMSAFGMFLLRAPHDWKRSHNFHHQNNTIFKTADVGSFPVMTLKQYQAATPKKQFQYRVIRNSLVIFFGYITCFMVETVKKMFYKDAQMVFQSVLTFVTHLSFMAWCFSYGVTNGILVGLFPHFLASMIGVYLFYVQHNFEGADFLPDDEWDYGYAALNSSSYVKGGPIFRFFSGNIGFHHIHHLNHKIPFYRLPEAMASIEALQNPTTLKITPSMVWRSLGLKLWDEDQHKFVGYPA